MTHPLEQELTRRFRRVRRTRGRNGLELRICCPFCRDRKFHMYVNAEKHVYNCYKCMKSGKLQDLIGETAFVLPKTPVELEPPPLREIKAPGTLVSLLHLGYDNPAVQYLTQTRKRPFELEELEKVYGACYCSQGRKIRTSDFEFDTTNTLVFPVWMNQKLVGWQARLLYDPEKLTDKECEAMGFGKDEDGDWKRPPKYLTSPGFAKGSALYNFDVARKYDYVVVTEGVFDAMSVGGPGVATFGTGISDQQCTLLKTYWNTVIILLDPDGTDKAASDVFNAIHRAVNVVHVKLKGYKDPGDAPRDEIWRQISDQITHYRKLHSTLVDDGLNVRRGAGATATQDPDSKWNIVG